MNLRPIRLQDMDERGKRARFDREAPYLAETLAKARRSDPSIWAMMLQNTAYSAPECAFWFISRGNG